MPTRSSSRWICYQALRFLLISTALYLLTVPLGLVGAMVTAGLFGLSLYYDYWSNTVELLSVALVLAAPSLGWDWRALLVVGLVLGTGRETLGFLAILGTPHALGLAAGAVFGHVLVRTFVRTEPHWQGTLEYATPMWRKNWGSIIGEHGPDGQWRVAIYALVLAAAVPSAPFLALALGIVTCIVARIDEPRVLTMLLPFAGMTLCR